MQSSVVTQMTISAKARLPTATQLTVAQLLGLPLSHVRVISNFVGGAFGGKAMVWPHVTLAALAARYVERPVKLVLTRAQTYHSHGHREEQEQTVTLGADPTGKLVAIRHEKLSITSPFDDWAERIRLRLAEHRGPQPAK